MTTPRPAAIARLLPILALGAGVAVLAGCQKELILQGERFSVREPIEASLPVAGQPLPKPQAEAANLSRPISLPAVTNADWPQRGGNSRHTSPHGALQTSPQLLWQVAIGQGDSRKNRVSAAPVAAAGRVFTLDAASHVQATSYGGAVLWTADLAGRVDGGDALSGGGLAVDGGTLFVTTTFGDLVALEAASGRILWKQNLGSPASGAPTPAGAVVYVVGRDGSAWAVDTKDGRVRWTLNGVPGRLGSLSSAAPAVGDQTVIFPYAGGGLSAALRNSGVRVWDSPLNGARLGHAYTIDQDVTGDPVLSGNAVYAGTAAGKTVAVDAASGNRLWTAGEGALGAPLVVGGSVFVISDENRLVRLDAANGAAIWAVDLPYFAATKVKKRQAIVPQYGPVLAGGRLVVASADGVLRFFNPVDGGALGSVALPGGAASSPALAGGLLFVVSRTGQLLAFR